MEDIKITEGIILESLNNKADIDGGNYKGSGLQAVLEETTLGTAGGTMTGALTLQDTLNIKKSDTLDYTDTNHTTASETAGVIYFRDKNAEVAGFVQTYFNQYNNMVLSTSARRSIDGTIKTAQTQLYVDANGNANFTFPICTTKATTTSSASASKVAVVVQNYVSGTSWYRVWSDGWIEQGGALHASLDTTHGVKTVTYLKSFSNANYTFVVNVGNNNAENISYYRHPYAKTNTGFTYNKMNTGIGNWYACGY